MTDILIWCAAAYAACGTFFVGVSIHEVLKHPVPNGVTFAGLFAVFLFWPVVLFAAVRS